MSSPETLPASPGIVHGLRLYYERNERQIAVAFFVGGFLFDLMTFERVDSWIAIGQQAFYLVIVTAVLTQMFLEEGRPPREPGDAFVIGRWYFQYRAAIANFFLGTLLNLYTIFFFKSSSLLVSFSFLAFLVFLLLANEFNRIRWLGLSFKYALLSLCGLSFCANVVPIFVGSIGVTVFLASMLAGCVPMAGLAWWIGRHAPDVFARARNQILVPFGLVLLGFLAFYLVKLIPPVPLSLPFIGVYHAVEKSEDLYRLSHERPPWRFWENGDQQFRAQPGDKVYVFFRIFSPTRFADEVRLRWYWKESGWVLQDSIPIKILGGRAEGFRGYGFKAKYQPGEWKVQVETTDGREIGRVYFDLDTGPEAPRSFQIDIQ
ncbi:MAG TPA: DUF2914 domain-containing protein [Burkholderiales bacterium]|nr:DUF2914 domain-containing protein [Burkholderiales bacterium]